MSEGLTERRRRIVREEIGTIAIGLFAERGFDAVTVNDIADAAGTSPRTIFRYFPSKDEIVFDYERRVRRRLLVALDARPLTEGPVTALREAYVATSHVEPEHRARIVALGRVLEAAPGLRARARGERVVADDELVDRIVGRLGTAHEREHARIIVASMSAVAGEVFWAWVAGGGRGDPAERIGSALGMLEQGLASLDADASHRHRGAS